MDSSEPFPPCCGDHNPTALNSSRLLGVGVLLLLLLAEVSFDLVPEEEHPQLAVRGLVHGLGLHAHAVLVRRQLVGAVLLVPQVEEASRRRSDHQEVAVEVLPVQVDIFASPAFDVDVKTSWRSGGGSATLPEHLSVGR